MNTNHYPNLELCRKLTEAGFGKTEKCFCPNCFGTGKECCNNPDHSFFDMCRAGGVGDAYGCPCCGGKIVMKGECDFCVSGIVNSSEFDKMEKMFDESVKIVCPSIMELLDEMPTNIKEGGNYLLEIHGVGTDNRQFNVRYETVYGSNKIWFQNDSLPNALAEMWLWLKENNYLTK